MRTFLGTLARFAGFFPSYILASIKLGTFHGRKQAELDFNPQAAQAQPETAKEN
jgi:hypothetical protein